MLNHRKSYVSDSSIPGSNASLELLMQFWSSENLTQRTGPSHQAAQWVFTSPNFRVLIAPGVKGSSDYGCSEAPLDKPVSIDYTDGFSS